MITMYAETEPDIVVECGGVVKPCVEAPVNVDLSQFANIEYSEAAPEDEASAEITVD